MRNFCGCTVRQRQTPKRFKRYLLVAVLVSLFGVVGCISVAAWSYSAFIVGIESMACGSASLVSTTPSSDVNSFSRGVVPVLDSLDDLRTQFGANSTLVNDILVVLEQTLPISTAVEIASQVFSVLNAMLVDHENEVPKDSDGQSMLHKNLLSASVPPVLVPALQALNQGVGAALAEVRADIAAKFASEQRQDFEDTLQTAARPLINVRDSLRSAFEPFLTEVSEGGTWNSWKYYFFLAYVGPSTCALLIGIMAILASRCFMTREVRKVQLSDSVAQSYNPWVHRTACCTWCCACGLAIMSLLSAGGIFVASSLFSGACLMLDDATSGTLQTIGPSLGLNMTDDQGEMLGGIMGCLNPADEAPLSGVRLSDVLFVRAMNGTKITVQQKLHDELRAEIDANFAAVSVALSSTAPPLASDSRVMELRALLGNNPAKSMIVPDYDIITASAPYSSLLGAVNAAAIGFGSSAACGDHTIVGAESTEPTAPGMTHGITAFMTELQALGDGTQTPVPPLACTAHVGCAPGSSAEQACLAGNALIDLKAGLQGSHNPYKCNLFADPATGAYCDPSDMELVANTNPPEYTSDCLASDGSMTMTTMKCNLDGFTAYLSAYDSRLDTVLQRVDASTVAVQAAINVTLRQLLYNEFIGQLNSLEDMLQCDHLAASYTKIVDGMCYQGVYGAWLLGGSFVALALLQLFVALPMYLIWRIGRDNVAVELGPSVISQYVVDAGEDGQPCAVGDFGVGATEFNSTFPDSEKLDICRVCQKEVKQTMVL